MSAESDAALAAARAAVDVDAGNGQEGPARAAGATKMDGTGQEPIGGDRANGVAGLNGASVGNVKGQGGSSSITVRPEVAAFALAMEEQLRANDHKGGWKNCDPLDLFAHLKEEVREVHAELMTPPVCYPFPVDKQVRVREECADVANMAMMVADVCGALPAAPPAQAPAEVGAVVGGERQTCCQKAEQRGYLTGYAEGHRALDAAGVPNAQMGIAGRLRLLTGERDELKAALDKARADLAGAEARADREEQRRIACNESSVRYAKERDAEKARADKAWAEVAAERTAHEQTKAARREAERELAALKRDHVATFRAHEKRHVELRAALATANARVAALEGDPRMGLRWGVEVRGNKVASAFADRMWAVAEADTFKNQPVRVIDLSAPAPSRPESGADKPAPASDGALRRAASEHVASLDAWARGNSDQLEEIAAQYSLTGTYTPEAVRIAKTGLALRAALSASAPGEGEGSGTKSEGSGTKPSKPVTYHAGFDRTRWIADAALRLACADISWSPSSGDGKDNDYGPRITQEGGDDPAIAKAYAESAREILEAAERAAGEREGGK